MKDYLSAFQQLISKVKNKVFIPKELKSIVPSLVQSLAGFHRSIVPVSIKKLDFKYIRGKHNDLNGSLVIALMQQLTKKPLSFYRSIVLSFT